MPQSPNDAMWDPRPRLVQEADHVDGGDSEGERGYREEARPSEGPYHDSGAVLVELASGPGMSPAAAVDVGRRLERLGFTLDEEFGAMPFGDPEPQTFLVRGRVSDAAVIVELERDPSVVKVWRDTPVAPF